MGPDKYRVKVLKYLNPHLIWVEVIDTTEEVLFEQIGIYGILPLDIVLNIQDKFKSKPSKVWLPAASVTMANILADAEEIWFYPTHIDRRSSIFQNNIHKYGDIVVKKPDGKEKNMSKQLKKSGFAVYDIPQFHEELSLGKICTKLNEVQVKGVIKDIKAHYNSTHRTTPWDEWVKTQTYIYHVMQEIQIISQLNMHKGETARKQLNKLHAVKNKLNDLDHCFGLDEESVGRGIIRHSPSGYSPLSKNIKMRKAKERSQYLEDTSSSGDWEFDLKFPRNAQNVLNDSTNSDTSLDESLAEIKMSPTKNKVTNKKEFEKKNEDIDDNADEVAQIAMRAQKSARGEHSPTIRLAYCPPGLNVTTLPVKNVPRLQMVSKSTNKEQIEEAKNNDIQKVKNYLGNITSVTNKTIPDIKSSPSVGEQKTKSLLLQRKLMQHKEKMPKNDSSTSDNNNSCEEPIQYKVNDVSSDDESLSDLIVKLDLKTSRKHIPIKEVDGQNTVVCETHKINPNPLRNLDGSNSVFVDKLISTVLMVHTKKNNRIRSYSNIREVAFSPDIVIVLRNMKIKAPTRLQTVSWNSILRGHSVFMIGPVGSGKTMGYLPAVCQLISVSRKQNPSIYPSCIIVCATAKSVSEVEKYSRILFGLDVRVLACYVGKNEETLTTSLLNGCDLLVCTPPMLARLLQTDFGIDLRDLTTFVIDDCERISDVYLDEIKLALYEVKKAQKNRANKEIKTQFVVASRVWCKFLESLTQKAPDSVVCIGSFQECVLYSKTRMLVDFVKKENKINAVVQFLKEVDGPKKVVIVCTQDDEVELLEKTLAKFNHVVFACNNTMTIRDLYNLNIAWGNYEEPTIGAILICCDSNLVHLNITNAHYLLHYSMPLLFSTFSKRFSLLNDNYPSIFTDQRDPNLKIKVLLEETNAEQLPKILNFVKRCTDNVPEALTDVAKKILELRNLKKAEDLVPICDTMLSFGQCADFWNCKSRHAILKDFDEPKEWMPVDGSISFKILHYHTADTYSVRLISNTVNGNTKKYPQTYSNLSIKMGMYFSEESNRRLHGIPKVGDVCAVSIKQNLFARCQVLKILDNYKNGNPNHVLLRLIDDEKFERSKDIHLYYLPDELKQVQTYVVQVKLANIKPKDKDVTYSNLAKNQLKKITDTGEDLYLRGNVILAVSNCVFVDTLEACQNLSSLNGTVVRYNFKQELLNGHAEPNPDHIPTLKRFSKDLKVKDENISEIDVPKLMKLLPKCRWAYLDSDDMSAVFLASVEDTDRFFVHLAKFRDWMDLLIKEINTYVKENPEPVETIEKGDIVLAEFPDDSMYERARIDDIYDGKVKCFFVDQGDWREVSTTNLVSITERFITEMPFQAIECRLVGVKPAGENCANFCTWFTDYCLGDENSINVRQLYLKYIDKTNAEYTAGYKYGVVLIDTNSEEDVIVNQLVIDRDLARVNEKEIKYLENLRFTITSPELIDSGSDIEEPKNVITPFQRITQAPLRSVPLVDSDNEFDDIDKWEFNKGDDEFMSVLTPNLALKGPVAGSNMTDEKSIKKITEETAENLMAIFPTNNLSMDMTKPLENNYNYEKEHKESDIRIPTHPTDTIKAVNTQSEKDIFENIDDTQFRKPRLTWYQNENLVIAKIHLIGIGDYVMNIKERHIKFAAEHNNTKYVFQFELYGVVDVSNSSHADKGQYILVKLKKILKKNWLSLTRDGNIRKWIAYDVDQIDTSSCDEDTDDPGKKNIHQNDESDSEDEDFTDDITYASPRYR